MSGKEVEDDILLFDLFLFKSEREFDLECVTEFDFFIAFLKFYLKFLKKNYASNAYIFINLIISS